MGKLRHIFEDLYFGQIFSILMTERGNLTLNHQEITDLRFSILDRYKMLTGVALEPKYLNSNVNNYEDLFTSIDNEVSLKSLGIITPKPLIGIFHTSKKHSENPKRFRKRFITALYKYALGCTRDEFIYTRHYDTSSVAVKQMKNIGGFWKCYYAKNKNFLKTLEDNGKCDIDIVALTIRGESINKATVRFHQSANWGKGSVEVLGSNLIFHLRSEKNNWPTSLFVNCGRTYVQDRDSHIRFAWGECIYITDSGSPKHSPCLMEYVPYPETKSTPEIDLTNDEFKTNFLDKKTISMDSLGDECVERIIAVFKRAQPQTQYLLL